MANKWLIATYLDFDNEPVNGLSPTIKIWNASTSALLVSGSVMTEVDDGIYKYNFSAYDPTEDYFAMAKANSSDVSNQYVYGSFPLSVDLGVITEAVWDVDLNDYTDVDTAGYRLNKVLHPKIKFST